MKKGAYSLLFLLLFFLGVASARDNQPDESILIGSIELRLGAPRYAVLQELRTKTNYLVSKLGDSGWVVSDKAAARAVAILTFDPHGKLSRVQRNWTPPADSSMILDPLVDDKPNQVVSAMALGQALYNLAQQMPVEDSGGKSHSCLLTDSRRLPVGKYAWLLDPGQPVIEVREINLTCGKRAIQIYSTEPTDATRASAGRLGIRKVLLYESISGEPPQNGRR